jgi:hypothetical protein
MMREMISSGRQSQVPLVAILFGGSIVLCCGKVEGKVMQVWMKLALLPRCLYVYIGMVDVAKHRPMGRFDSQELQAHHWRNHSPTVRQFIL